MCDEFAKIIHDEFDMSMMGDLNFFLGLQIKQMEDGIFFNQSNYIKEMLKKFSLEDSKPMKTPMSSDTKLTKDEEYESVDSTKYRGMIGTTHLGLWYPKGTDIETIVYANSDHARDYVDQKSTSGICTFVGCCLTSWFSKKQTALAISTTEAEYVSAGKACQQALWMKQALIDYDENVFCLGGNRDHIPACLCYMLYCVANSERFNLAYFMAKRMEWVTKQTRLILPYGMLLTRLLDFINGENIELQNESYVLYDRVMNPLAAQLERKPRRDRGTRRGRHSTSSSSAFDQPSSSHLNDDDDDVNDEGTSRASTPSPIRYVNSLTNQVP
ncbi:copia protein [Tanacetum coccineum]